MASASIQMNKEDGQIVDRVQSRSQFVYINQSPPLYLKPEQGTTSVNKEFMLKVNEGVQSLRQRGSIPCTIVGHSYETQIVRNIKPTSSARVHIRLCTYSTR